MDFGAIRAHYHEIRAVFELLYFIAGVGLLVVGGWALKQLGIAKDDIAIRVKREAAQAASDQLHNWANSVIPTWEKLVALQHELKLPQVSSDTMRRFDIDELSHAPGVIQKHAATMVGMMDANGEFRTATMSACNLVEASAMCFVTGVANEEMAFMSLSGPFCQMVEMTYYVYCGMRQKGESYPWDYTVKLYGIWSQRRKAHKLSAQQQSLSEAIAAATKAAAPIKPIGTA